MPMGPAFPSLAMIERRIDTLAMAWMIYAAVTAFFGIVGLLFAQAALHGMIGPWSNWPHGHSHLFGWGVNGWDGPALPLFFMKLGWIFLTIRVGLAAIAGYGLRQKAPWARGFAIVVGILSLIHPPFGTGLGIWTLIVLMNAPNAAGYEAMARG
jgi:hypothetical protein